MEQCEGSPSYTKLKNRELTAQTSKIGKSILAKIYLDMLSLHTTFYRIEEIFTNSGWNKYVQRLPVNSGNDCSMS